MPSWSELAQLLTAIGVIATAWQSWHNGRKIELIRHATNSMKDALVAATGKAAHAEGVAEGRAAAVDAIKAS